MSLRTLLLTGQGPLPPRRLPSYVYAKFPTSQSTTAAAAHESSAKASVALLWKLWMDGKYNELMKKLLNVGDFIGNKDETRYACEFLAAGGLDVYCLMLIDPFNPLHFILDRVPRNMLTVQTRGQRRMLDKLLAIYAEILLQLTDLLANQNDLGWVIYDRYPGLLYRLIEFLEDGTLWVSATGLLEHTLACVGPVIEISKTPSLIRVLRQSPLAALSAFCRFLALLILPGLAQGQNPIVCRRLHYPETVTVLRQVQRVVDSNVLWLIGEEWLISTLIGLCELRPNGLRVQQGGRSMMMLPSDAFFMNSGMRIGSEEPVTAAPIANEDADWEDEAGYAEEEDEEEEDEPWTMNEEQEGSAVSGGSDGTADFLFDSSSLPTLVAGIGWLLGLTLPQTPQQIPPAVGRNERNASPAEVPTAAPGRRVPPPPSAPHPTMNNARSTAAILGFLRGGSAGGGTLVNQLDEDRLVAAPNTVQFYAASGVGTTPAAPVGAAAPAPAITDTDFDLIGLPREGPEQIAFFNRIASNRFQPTDPARLVQWMLDRDMLEEDDTEHSFKSSIEIRWWVGAADTRQRWRVRDPSLIPERDDNRYAVLSSCVRRTSSPAPRPPSREDFIASNKRLSRRLFQSLPPVSDVSELDAADTQRIVESQSEVLYLLNMSLSTFYFSDAWKLMRDCEWVERSVAMVEVAFALDPSLPAFVDVPPHINLPPELRRLPRYLPPRSSSVSPSDGDTAVLYPETWRVVPLLEALGDSATVYLRDPNQMPEEEPDNHQHGPDTMRKMELLRGLYEYWNAQDRREEEMITSDADVRSSAWSNAKAMGRVLLRDEEDSCVRVSVYQSLDSYLRTFLFSSRDRQAEDSPQTILGQMLLTNTLDRVYNGTTVPGLSVSMKPARLQSIMLQFLGELTRYHPGNLRVLRSYVVGEKDLSHLNKTVSNGNRQHPVILSAAHEEIEKILKLPPLEREEHEPFGSVLLRRLLSFGGDTHHLLRSLLLSLTPGLRATGNYLSKPVDRTIKDVRLPSNLPGTGRTNDIISGDGIRTSYVIRVSRQFVCAVSRVAGDAEKREALMRDLLRALARTPHRQAPEDRPFPGLMCEEGDLALLSPNTPLPFMGPPVRLQARLFASREAQRHGEASRGVGAHLKDIETTSSTGVSHNNKRGMKERLCTASAQADAALLDELAPLSRLLLSEPHKLVFSALCSLNIEAMEDNSRLSVISTVLLVFLRVAVMNDAAKTPSSRKKRSVQIEANIRAVMAKMRPFAQHGFDVWRVSVRNMLVKERRKQASAIRDASSRGGEGVPNVMWNEAASKCDWCHSTERENMNAPRYSLASSAGLNKDKAGVSLSHLDAPLSNTEGKHDRESAKGELAPDAIHWRCASFMTYGSCDPPHEGTVYQREFGGCFYRSFFRLLCLWVGYYASCQRYVETIYFSTEVAFGEYRTMALFLLRILPDYFMPSFSQVEGCTAERERAGATPSL